MTNVKQNATDAVAGKQGRADGENQSNASHFREHYKTHSSAASPKTNERWSQAVARWQSGDGFRGYVIEMAEHDAVSGRAHFNMAFIVESARRRCGIGRDDAEFKHNNDCTSAYARLLLHDRPEFAPYIETRKSRFDVFFQDDESEQPTLFDLDSSAVA